MTKAFRAALPQYDFLYLGDTLHVPYGPRSASAILQFTTQAVDYLFDRGCPIVIIACNTASAKTSFDAKIADGRSGFIKSAVAASRAKPIESAVRTLNSVQAIRPSSISMLFSSWN